VPSRRVIHNKIVLLLKRDDYVATLKIPLFEFPTFECWFLRQSYLLKLQVEFSLVE
jgi:hypothetical protein